jgi:hypothetical protein
MIEIKSRPVLPDKLQLHISPNFLAIDDDTELWYDGHLSPFFEKEIQQLYSAKMEYFNGVKKTRRPYFLLPNDFNPSTSDYIWNTRISIQKPYTITVDFNFIRNILSIIKENANNEYNEKYHKSIQLHDDNFIDNVKIWSKWDDTLITDIEFNLKARILQCADSAFRYLVEDHELIYSIVSLKHAEFNIDYYVGSNNSLPLILAFQQFIYSDRGREWRSEIESIGMIQHSSQHNFDKSITNEDGNNGHTFKFSITKGLSLKVYQKSKDHIRVEIVFEGSFIKQRFHVYAFDKVYPELEKFTIDFFKEINFEGILYLLSKNIYQDSKIISFIDKYDPILIPIIQCVIYEQPISDTKSINRIRSDSKLRPFFSRTLDYNGNHVYLYNPSKRQKRISRLRPPTKNKQLPKQSVRCSFCKSCYHGDLIRCPYCEEKNPAHDNTIKPDFIDFLRKVDRYKEGGYSGF